MPVFSGKPYSVEVAYNREKAMKKIEAEKPNLILRDIMLDKVDDFTLFTAETQSGQRLRRGNPLRALCVLHVFAACLR